MNVARTILLCAIAAVGSGLAIAGGSNASVVLPAAALAVVAAAVLLVEVVEQTRWPPAQPRGVYAADPAWIRSAFEAGTYGRTSLVQILDGLERSTVDPNRPNATLAELSRIRSMSTEQFRQYLAGRLDTLEREP